MMFNLIAFQVILLLTSTVNHVKNHETSHHHHHHYGQREHHSRQARQAINTSLANDRSRLNLPPSSQSQHLLTILKSLEIDETTIRVTWRLSLGQQQSTRTKINLTLNSDKSKVYFPAEWTIKVRQFGTLYVKVRFISEIVDWNALEINGYKDISFIVSQVIEGTAYEFCLFSKEFPVLDEIDSIVRRISVSAQPEVEKNVVCKEITTKRDTSLPPAQVATVTAVSSASTLVIVVIVGWCWCPKRKERRSSCESNESTNNQQKRQHGNNSSSSRWFRLRDKLRCSTTRQALMNEESHENSVKGKRRRPVWTAFWKRSSKSVKLSKIGNQGRVTIYRPKSWPQDEWTCRVKSSQL